MEEIRIEEVLTNAWEGFKNNWQPLIIWGIILGLAPVAIVVVFYFTLLGVSEFASPTTAGVTTIIGFFAVLTIISLLIAVVSGGFTKLSFMIYEGKTVSFSDFWLGMGTSMKLSGLYILLFICILLGCAFCILPGIVAAFFFSLASILLIEDSSKSVFDCIKESVMLVKGNLKPVLLCVLVCWAISAVLSSTGVGSIILLPASALIMTGVYLKIKSLNSSSADAAPAIGQ